MTDTEKKVAAMRKPKKGKMTKVPQWPGSWPYLVGIVYIIRAKRTRRVIVVYSKGINI